GRRRFLRNANISSCALPQPFEVEQGSQLFAEQRAPPAQTRPDRSDRAANYAGPLLVAHPVQVAQDDHLAVMDREAQDRAPHPFDSLRPYEGRRGTRVRSIAVGLVLERHEGTVTPKRAPDVVARDPVEVGSERAARSLEQSGRM